MALLSASGICKSYGADSVLENISFEVRENDRIGLIGCNGSGKTTLFQILTGELSSDAGEISIAAKAKPGYMRQHVCRNLERSACDAVLTVFSFLLEMEAELEKLSKLLQSRPENQDALVEKQAALNERYAREGGLTFRSRTRSALLGLGFAESELAAPVSALSGGQRAKLQLAKLLLGGAGLLLLDEPTNHLDIPSVEWLEEYLRSFPGAYIVISHDRFFLDRITNRTFELRNHRLTAFSGNYTAYLAQRDERLLSAKRRYDSTMKEIGRLNGIVEQQRRWNQERNYKTAESKMKAISRLESTLEKPEAEDKTFHFRFGIRQRSGNDVLTAENLALSFAGKTLFRNADLEIHRGDRVFLLGPNGCGKTSLLKVLLGIYKPSQGAFRFGTGIEVGYYDQLQTGLRQDKTVIDEIWDYYPKMTQTEVRSALAVFLFQGDDVFKPVAALSGGERARVLLLRLMLSQNNFLLLDEPTNHLDIPSCEALENALQDYEGTLLIVSHDRYLINKLAGRIYALGPSGTRACGASYEEYAQAALESREAPAKERASDNKNEYLRRKEQQAALRREKAELARLEEQIDRNESSLRELNAQLCAPETACDYEAALTLSAKTSELKKENDELLRRWSQLAQEYEDA